MMSERKKKWWKKIKKNSKKMSKIRQRVSKQWKGIPRPKGEKASGWRGGRFELNGYVYIYYPKHPHVVKGGKGGGGYVLEHRLVMEKKLGRYLTKQEDVHHVNGKKDDNRIKNLILVSHQKHYHKVECPKCKFKFNFQ